MALHSPSHVVAWQEHPADSGAHWRSGGHDRGSFVCEGDDMSGRPDYDVGDLVVHVGEPHHDFPPVGSVWIVEAINGPDRVGDYGVKLAGYKDRFEFGLHASEFRKIDPKPPEFFTGTIEANQRDNVPA